MLKKLGCMKKLLKKLGNMLNKFFRDAMLKKIEKIRVLSVHRHRTGVGSIPAGGPYS